MRLLLRIARGPLLAALLLAGCTDSLGTGSNCEAEMREVLRRLGPPDSVQRGSEGQRFTERWYYSSGAEGRVYYQFTWGAGDEACVVNGPVRFSLLPDA